MPPRITEISARDEDISNAELVRSINRLAQDPSDQNREDFLACLAASTLLVPLAVDISPVEADSAEESLPFTAKDQGFPVSCIVYDDDSLLFPAFSDRESLAEFAVESTVCLVVEATELFRYFLNYSAEVFGINPMSGASVQIGREEIRKLVEAPVIRH